MRYKLIARIEGEVYAREAITIQQSALLFEFVSDPSGKIIEVGISTQLPDEAARRFRSSVAQDDQGRLTLNIEEDLGVRETLVRELQSLEANLAFALMGALRKVRWDDARQELIPETPSEENTIAVRGFDVLKRYPQRRVEVGQRDLKSLIIEAAKYRLLDIPKAFFHEGINFFDNFQYIQAFYNFYFVIEDFYARGKTGKKAVLQEFAKSREFTDICEKALKALMEDVRHADKLKVQLEREKCEASVHGLQEFLFQVRGNLHHFYSKNTKTHGTPFNQGDFESVALLTMFVASAAIDHRAYALRVAQNEI